MDFQKQFLPACSHLQCYVLSQEIFYCRQEQSSVAIQPFPFHRNYTSLNLNRASRIGDSYLDAGQVYVTLMLDRWFLPWWWTGVSYLDAGQVFGRSDDVSAQVELVHASEGDDVDFCDVISCYLRKTHKYTKTSASRSLHLVLNLWSSLKVRQKNWNACFYSCHIWFCSRCRQFGNVNELFLWQYSNSELSGQADFSVTTFSSQEIPSLFQNFSYFSPRPKTQI